MGWGHVHEKKGTTTTIMMVSARSDSLLDELQSESPVNLHHTSRMLPIKMRRVQCLVATERNCPIILTR
jgi:hypothetical protein